MGSLLLLQSKHCIIIIRSCWVYRSFWAQQDGGRVTSQLKRLFPIQCLEISGSLPYLTSDDFDLCEGHRHSSSPVLLSNMVSTAHNLPHLTSYDF